jgi:hypothetical protein
MRDESGVRFGLANGVLVVAFFVCAATGISGGRTELIAIGVAGLATVGLPRVMSLCVGVVAWALFTGFVENRYGQLTFADGDIGRLVLFALATLALATLARRTLAITENADE